DWCSTGSSTPSWASHNRSISIASTDRRPPLSRRLPRPKGERRMQEPIESTGRNVEEALASALAALGAKAAEVRWDVVESGSTGLRKWFGGRPARVRVERVVYKHADVRSLVEDLLAAMDIPAVVEVTKRADTVEVMITTQGLD